jgi:hypothetical protein
VWADRRGRTRNLRYWRRLWTDT